MTIELLAKIVAGICIAYLIYDLVRDWRNLKDRY
jgi:hypothetical protein